MVPAEYKGGPQRGVLPRQGGISFDRNQVKNWWNLLTDDDLDRIGGSVDELAGTLQEHTAMPARKPNARSSAVSGQLAVVRANDKEKSDGQQLENGLSEKMSGDGGRDEDQRGKQVGRSESSQGPPAHRPDRL